MMQSANRLVHKHLQLVHSTAGSRRPLSLIAQLEGGVCCSSPAQMSRLRLALMFILHCSTIQRRMMERMARAADVR